MADKATADTFGNRFFIPLDIELLKTHMPFYRSALDDRLEYKLTFNDYNRVIQATGAAGLLQRPRTLLITSTWSSTW